MQQYNLNKVIGVVEVEPNVTECVILKDTFRGKIVTCIYMKEVNKAIVLKGEDWQFLSTSKDMTPQLLEKFDQFNTIDELRAWELANGYVTVNPVPQPEAQFDEYGNGGYCETWVKEYEQAQQQVVNIAYLIKG